MALFLLLLLPLCLVSNVLCQSTGDVRLVGSTSTGSGRLEIYLENQWGTVCDHLFDAAAAIVACEQLGYASYVNFSTASSASISSPVWLSGLICPPSAPSLLSCQHSGVGNHQCSHDRDVFLECTDPVFMLESQEENTTASSNMTVRRGERPTGLFMGPFGSAEIAIMAVAAVGVVAIIVGIVLCIVLCVCCFCCKKSSTNRRVLPLRGRDTNIV